MCEALDALPKDFSFVKDMGALLKCGICYEYLQTALVTPCSHNYCSYCIRKSLLYKTQCPSCSEETTEMQLRNNRVLDELIAIFLRLTEKLVKYFVNVSDSACEEGNRTTERDEVTVSEPIPSTSTVCERTPVSSSPDIVEMPKKKANLASIFSPKKQSKIDVPTVLCPVCSVDVPEKNINLHLDACLRRAEGATKTRKPKAEKPKPLPKLVYTLLNDKSLKKKLSEHGLSTAGDRNTLISRHKRFTLLYNSECDSLNPRPVSKLIEQIEKEEREEKKLAAESPQKRLVLDRKADPKDIEKAQRQYLQQHKASFESLIQSMRKQAPKVNLLDRLPEERKTEVPGHVSANTEDSEVVLVNPEDSEPAPENDSGNTDSSDADYGVERLELSSVPAEPDNSSEKTEIISINSDSSGDHSQPLSPVLNTRSKVRKAAHNISSTPDMFEDGNDSEDSNASISLMIYHTQESSLNEMPPSTYIGPPEIQNGLSQSPEALAEQENKSLPKHDPCISFQGENGLNFDFDIDNLLTNEESQPIVPPRKRSKRKVSVASTSSEELPVQRVLRKRVKR